MPSPLKIQILERWEKQAYKGLENAMHQLQQVNHVWVDTGYIDGQELYYVDIGLEFLTWNSYNLIVVMQRTGRNNNLWRSFYTSATTMVWMDKSFP